MHSEHDLYSEWISHWDNTFRILEILFQYINTPQTKTHSTVSIYNLADKLLM